jgi:hypothetical protein
MLMEAHMQSFSAQTAATAYDGPETAKAHWYVRLATLFPAVLNRLASAHDDRVANRYAGCAWNDTTERQIFDDIAIRHGRHAIM